MNPKYKTVPCRNYHSPVGCPYPDNKCKYIHNLQFKVVNILIPRVPRFRVLDHRKKFQWCTRKCHNNMVRTCRMNKNESGKTFKWINKNTWNCISKKWCTRVTLCIINIKIIWKFHQTMKLSVIDFLFIFNAQLTYQ